MSLITYFFAEREIDRQLKLLSHPKQLIAQAIFVSNVQMLGIYI